jgi:septum formation protein
VYHRRVRVLLASASPRRAHLLEAAGIAFDTRATEVDETPEPGERPRDYVRRLALEKARTAASGLDYVVIGADTTVVVNGRMMGKPADATDAAGMLRQLSGTTHEVLTGIAVKQGGLEFVDVACTRVTFVPLTPEEIAWYVATGEPEDKAGAYAIQGLASRFVESIEGSYSNVVGLPVSLVYQLLRQAGWAPELPGVRHRADR